MSALQIVLAIAAILAIAPRASAQAAPDVAPTVEAQAGRRGAGTGRRRDAETGSRERVIFFPLHAISEYLLRRPIVAILNGVGRHHTISRILHVLHPVPEFHWAPSVLVELGYRTMGGANFTWDHAGVHGNQIAFNGITGGPGYADIGLRDQLPLGHYGVGLRLHWYDRPDRAFFGLGPLSSESSLSRDRLYRRGALATFDWRHSTSGVPGFGTHSFVVGTATLAVDTRGNSLERTGAGWKCGARVPSTSSIPDCVSSSASRTAKSARMS